jgi:hypothetical protein
MYKDWQHKRNHTVFVGNFIRSRQFAIEYDRNPGQLAVPYYSIAGNLLADKYGKFESLEEQCSIFLY